MFQEIPSNSNTCWPEIWGQNSINAVYINNSNNTRKLHVSATDAVQDGGARRLIFLARTAKHWKQL